MCWSLCWFPLGMKVNTHKKDKKNKVFAIPNWSFMFLFFFSFIFNDFHYKMSLIIHYCLISELLDNPLSYPALFILMLGRRCRVQVDLKKNAFWSFSNCRFWRPMSGSQILCHILHVSLLSENFDEVLICEKLVASSEIMDCWFVTLVARSAGIDRKAGAFHVLITWGKMFKHEDSGTIRMVALDSRMVYLLFISEAP